MGYQIIVECECDGRPDAINIMKAIDMTTYFILEKVIIYNPEIGNIQYDKPIITNLDSVIQINIIIYPNQISEDIYEAMNYICSNLIEKHIFAFKIIHSR